VFFQRKFRGEVLTWEAKIPSQAAIKGLAVKCHKITPGPRCFKRTILEHVMGPAFGLFILKLNISKIKIGL